MWLVLKKGSGQAEANQLRQLGALIRGNGSPLIRIWSKSKGQLSNMNSFLEFDLFALKDFETCEIETLVPLQKRLVMTLVVS